MSLRFRGVEIPGIVEPFAIPSRETQNSRRHFWAVRGESEIRGKPGGRTLQFSMLVFDAGNKFASYQGLALFFSSDVGQLLNEHGTLQVVKDNSALLSFPDCTLDVASIRQDPGILRDEAGTLGGKWFCMADFVFRQL